MPKHVGDPAILDATFGAAEGIIEVRRQEALLKTGALQNAILNSANFSSIATDEKGVVQIFNIGAERMLGYTVADVLNKITPADISDPQELVARAKALSLELGTTIRPGFEALVFKASRGIEDIYELTYIRKDGSRFPAVVSVTALRDDQDAIIGYLLIGTDNSARKRAEEALLKAGALQSAIFNSANFSSIATDAKGVIQIFNVGAERMLGYAAADVMNKITSADISDPQEVIARAKALSLELGTRISQGFEALVFKASRGIEDIYELTYIRKDGSRFPAVVSVTALRDAENAIIGYLLIGTDNTARKQAEEEHRQLLVQLHQSQKMESLGMLAGGVAHDMNNVLGAILVLASVHMEIQPTDSAVHRAFTTITKACSRGGNLIRSLLSFARQDLAEEKELDLNALVLDEVRLLERTTLARVRLEMDLAADLRLIRGDASALTHVLMNLCVNAVDAMPDNGILILRTRNVDTDWIEVQVVDTGSGMPKEVLEKALDPFFTTKEQGKGTGLGLSIAHSTVMAHHGQLEIQSEPGHGTSVILRFPSCEPEIPALEVASAPPRAASDVRLKILLVDDDELIQSAMASILEILGHTVTAVFSGEEALAKLEAGFQPDVVTLDMNMPGLGGARTLPRLRALRPTVPVLLCTGRVDQSALDLVAAHAGVTLLAKPFSSGELQQHLDALGLASSATG